MSVTPFATILDAARARHGAAALEARLPTPKSADELKATPDDRYLSQMSLRIFRAGLKHSLVDAKWPAFEEVFHGFDPRRVRAMSDEAMEGLLADKQQGRILDCRDRCRICSAVEDRQFGHRTARAVDAKHLLAASR